MNLAVGKADQSVELRRSGFPRTYQCAIGPAGTCDLCLLGVVLGQAFRHGAFRERGDDLLKLREVESITSLACTFFGRRRAFVYHVAILRK